MALHETIYETIPMYLTLLSKEMLNELLRKAPGPHHPVCDSGGGPDHSAAAPLPPIPSHPLLLPELTARCPHGGDDGGGKAQLPLPLLFFLLAPPWLWAAMAGGGVVAHTSVRCV